MELHIARFMLEVRSSASALVDRAMVGEEGEGVISAAIAVLIMAFLGAAMWLAFDALFTSAAEKTTTEVNKIGS